MSASRNLDYLKTQLSIKTNQLENLKNKRKSEDNALSNRLSIYFFNKPRTNAETLKMINEVEKEIIALQLEIKEKTTLMDKAEEIASDAGKIFNRVVDFFDFRSEEQKHAARQAENKRIAEQHAIEWDKIRVDYDLPHRERPS